MAVNLLKPTPKTTTTKTTTKSISSHRRNLSNSTDAASSTGSNIAAPQPTITKNEEPSSLLLMLPQKMRHRRINSGSNKLPQPQAPSAPSAPTVSKASAEVDLPPKPRKSNAKISSNASIGSSQFSINFCTTPTNASITSCNTAPSHNSAHSHTSQSHASVHSTHSQSQQTHHSAHSQSHHSQSLTSPAQEEKKSKRKRREYLKDERYAGVRKVVEELNKAIGVEARRAALGRALVEFGGVGGGSGSNNGGVNGNVNEGVNGNGGLNNGGNANGGGSTGSNNTNIELHELHTASLYLGAPSSLTLLLSMSDDEAEISTISSALELVYRGSKDGIVYSYREVGAALVPLCLRLLDRMERRRTMEGCMADISKVLLYMTRISELRGNMVSHPGMLAALERVGHVSSIENRVLRMRILANLANSEKNKGVIFERTTLLEAVLKVATLDKSDSVREYASAVLMDLASCPVNQVGMARIDKVLATFVKLAIVEDKIETREYAVSGLQNLAFEKRNRVQLVTYGKGVVVEALKKTISSDVNEKTRRRSAGALTNLACDDTAEKMGSHEGLLQTLSKVAVSDSNRDVQQRATLALTKLANSVTIEMSCWSLLLDALIDASRCTVSDGIVSAMFRVKTRSEENRSSMASHPRLLETLAQLVLSSEHKDCENATKAIAHLANEPNNHKLICSKHVLAALVHAASLDSHAVTRDAAILALERMAMEHANRPMMARYPGMLVTIAQATEREMREEASGMVGVSGTGQPRLAKPLLMSLLVAL